MKSKVITGIVLTVLLIGMLALAFEVDVSAGEAILFVDSGQNLGTGENMGLALGDLDDDGDLDAFITTTWVNRVWKNNGDGNLYRCSESWQCKKLWRGFG